MKRIATDATSSPIRMSASEGSSAPPAGATLGLIELPDALEQVMRGRRQSRRQRRNLVTQYLGINRRVH